MQYSEQSINNVIQVKQYVNAIRPIYEALTGAKSLLLHMVRGVCLSSHFLRTLSLTSQWCDTDRVEHVQELIRNTVNDDVTYQSQPLDLRNQRTYAVKVSNWLSLVNYSVVF